jgi:hypothetical protein
MDFENQGDALGLCRSALSAPKGTTGCKIHLDRGSIARKRSTGATCIEPDDSPRADYYVVAAAFDFVAFASLEVPAFKSRLTLLILPVNLFLPLA